MTRSRLLALALLLAAPASARRKAEVPPPSDLLSIALHPTASYRGQGRVQYVAPGGKAKSQALSVAASGARFRREVASSAKKPAALVEASDGKTRSLLHVRPGTRWAGPAFDAAELRTKLLNELYDLRSSTGGTVAKRSTWRLDFHEKKGGALRRSWWLDRRSGAVLRREQYRADGSPWRRERLSRFVEGEPGAEALELPSGETRAWTEPGGLRWRPDGFLPLEARRDGGKRVYGYGDGRSALTLVVSPMRRGFGPSFGAVSGSDVLRLRWDCGGKDCALSGDVLEDELRLAAASVEPLP